MAAAMPACAAASACSLSFAICSISSSVQPARRVAAEHLWQERLRRSPEEKARWAEVRDAYLRRLKGPG